MPKRKLNWPSWPAISIIISVLLAVLASIATYSFASGGLHARMDSGEARDDRLEDKIGVHYHDLNAQVNLVLDEVRYLSALTKLHLGLEAPNLIGANHEETSETNSNYNSPPAAYPGPAGVLRPAHPTDN